LSEAEIHNAPIIRLSETDVDLSELPTKKNKIKHKITVFNDGKLPLIVSKMQVFNPSITVVLRHDSVKPGASTTLEFTINRKGLKKQKGHLRILLICNDPENPKAIINVKL
jgi:hypothetical protein